MYTSPWDCIVAAGSPAMSNVNRFWYVNQYYVSNYLPRKWQIKKTLYICSKSILLKLTIRVLSRNNLVFAVELRITAIFIYSWVTRSYTENFRRSPPPWQLQLRQSQCVHYHHWQAFWSLQGVVDTYRQHSAILTYQSSSTGPRDAFLQILKTGRNNQR